MDSCALNEEKCTRTSTKCIRPNKWINFLIRNGGTGKTRTQLRNRYRALHNIPNECAPSNKLGRNVWRSFQGFLTRDAPVCDRLNALPVADDPYLNYSAYRRSVFNAMQNGRFKLEPNFSVADFKISHLYKCYRLIDRFFLRNSLAKYFANTGFVLTFKIVELSPDNTLVHSQMWFRRIDANSGEIVLNKTKFAQSISRGREIDGVIVYNRLNALIVTMCHELSHAITESSCWSRVENEGHGGHGPTFLRTNHALFGLSSTIFTYDDNPPLLEVD